MTIDLTLDPSVSAEAAIAARTSVRDLSTADLLARAHATHDPGERKRLIDEVVILNMNVAKRQARRYYGRGVNSDDLDQVAFMALVRAAQNFDPRFGKEFLSYAAPTIRGELKKHFRDSAWTIKPPRTIQELQVRINEAREQLHHDLGRSPRPRELAEYLEVELDRVIEALSADGCFTPSSLDKPVGDGDDFAALGDFVPADADDLGAAEARLLLGPVMRRLDERDRRIIELRFYHDLTQQEIADDIGVTQMHVSRLIRRILTVMRHQLDHSTVPAAVAVAG